MGVNTCCKYLMFFFNLLIFIGGLAMVGIGVWALKSTDSFQQMITDDPGLMNAVYFIIAAGAFLVVIGFFGCCGAIKENKCMLGIFFFMVFIIFVVEIVGGVLAFTKLPETERIIKESMKQYEGDSPQDKTITEAWDTVQKEFQCCGYESAADWALLLKVPCNPLNQGCKYVFKKYFLVLGGVALGVLFIEILAMIFSCCIMRQVGKDRGY